MRLYELIDHQTKDSQKITFSVIKNLEEFNRGFRVDKIIAKINNIQVGYLRISWIPKKDYNTLYPTLYNVNEVFGGSSTFGFYASPFETTSKCYQDPHTFTDGEFDSFYQNLSSKLYKLRFPTTQIRAEQQTFVDEISEPFLRKHFPIINSIEATLDKPIVDYINVKENDRQGIVSDNSSRGIGFGLYKAGDKYCKSLGLYLYASSLQSPEAQKMWSRFESVGWVKKDKDRKYLDIQS